MTWLLATEVLVVIGALVVGGVKPGDGYTAYGIFWGSVLALISAVALMLLNLLVASRAGRYDPATAAGAQFIVVLVLVTPFLVSAHNLGARDVTLLTAPGALGVAHGLVLMWKALALVDPSTVSVIGLNEAVVASLIVMLVVPGRLPCTRRCPVRSSSRRSPLRSVLVVKAVHHDVVQFVRRVRTLGRTHLRADQGVESFPENHSAMLGRQRRLFRTHGVVRGVHVRSF